MRVRACAGWCVLAQASKTAVERSARAGFTVQQLEPRAPDLSAPDDHHASYVRLAVLPQFQEDLHSDAMSSFQSATTLCHSASQGVPPPWPSAHGCFSAKYDSRLIWYQNTSEWQVSELRNLQWLHSASGNGGSTTGETMQTGFPSVQGIHLPNMSIKSLLVLSATIEYSRSFNLFPALMLSRIHSGLTTCTLTFDFVVSNLCVFDPLSCCDVKMCVAREAVCLQDHVNFRLTATRYDGKPRTGLLHRPVRQFFSSRYPSYLVSSR